MKRNIISLTMLLCTAFAGAQVNTQNYIRIRKMLNNTETSYVDDIRYYDGLGRPFQTVQKSVQGGTVKERTGTLQEYDSAGRGSSQWLPTPLTADYLAPGTFKTTAQGSTGYGDTYPYSQPLYEASPLDRPSKHYGAGAAWRSADRPVKTEYLLNTVSGVQACKLYNTSGTSTGNYAAGTLHVVKTTDEDNHVAYTFTDKQGRTVLERRVNGTEYLDTYSVYDDFGNLVLVLQPEYQTTANLSLHAFRYEYDHRNLCSKKTLPGAEFISYEYDDADRLIFSQDGNQRPSDKWTYYLYDKYGRMTEQGECTGKATDSGMVHIRNYYDSYSFVESDSFSSGYPAGNETYSTGFLTGTEVTVLGSSDKICTVYHYDGKGRVIKSISNNLLGGMETTTTTYSFTDQPLTVTHTHTATGKTSRTEVYTYTYDHSDRLSTVKHKLGSGSEVTLASYTYDNKGRMATKRLHGSSTNTLTYSYNIRSWLTGISSGKFTQTLGYGSHYNGNISSMNWTANGTSHAYTFTYDDVNRMLNATHGTGAYTEKVTAYDKNGNIKALQRYGNGLIDNLTYTYSGNQLTKVEDATGNTAGFNNGASTANEYVYDNNGNLTKDSNKGITNIAYNCLNLPSTVTFTDGSTIVYSYAADGTKLRTVHTISGTTTQKDYCANVVYEDSIQKLLLTEEGYVDLSVMTPAYYYYLKDHQGNNRVVLSSGDTVAEVNHYYPFGGVFASSGNVQPYKYNGKELDTKKGLSWYDYGARHYDAALGRWLVADPLAEKYYAWSSYAYCNNNPIGAIDSEGKLVIFINGFHHGFEGASFKYWNTIYGQFDDAVMTHFGDNKSLYYDGSMGGLLNLLASGNFNGSNYINTYPHNRYNWGYSLGKIQAGRIISQLTRDAKGNISEAVRVVSHSMGSVFAKGFVQALINYVKMHPEECQGFMISEYDFAPFQPTSYPAVDGVSTYQYSHKYDLIAKNARVLGAEIMKTSENVEDGHSIEDYYKYIISLPEGNYKFINGEFVKQ